MDNLGSCELNIMVQPPSMPYIEQKNQNPGGYVGLYIEEMSRILNFTPNYVWSWKREDQLAHTQTNNMNVLLDLLPRILAPVTKFSFCFNVVKSGWILPSPKQTFNWSKFTSPYDYITWILIASILLCSLVLGFFWKEGNSGSESLKFDDLCKW